MPEAEYEFTNPFSNGTILNWLFNNQHYSPNVDVVTIGSGPFPKDLFNNALKQMGLSPWEPDGNIEILIVSTEFDELKIEQMLRLRRNSTLKVYSQEMFLFCLATNRDLHDGDKQVLEEFGKGHPALEFLSNWGFDWRTVRVPMGKGGKLDTTNWNKWGFLGYLGYSVEKKKSLSEKERRKILEQAFTDYIPTDIPGWLKKQWGKPQTSTRLKKMADSIASWASNQGGKPNYKQAVDKWTADLSWLKKNYYDNRFDFKFKWPEIGVNSIRFPKNWFRSK